VPSEKKSNNKSASSDKRERLVARVNELAQDIVCGSTAETFRTCGNPGCRCHHGGPKHGPHTYVTFRRNGKNKGYYVPRAAEAAIKSGIQAWRELQDTLDELADANSAAILARGRAKSS